MMQADLFAEAAYPNTPGARRNRCSRDAAQCVRPVARPLREQVFVLIKDNALTADEAAALLGRSVLAIRPRLSELVKQGRICDSGHTRKNTSGIKATVWRIAA